MTYFAVGQRIRWTDKTNFSIGLKSGSEATVVRVFGGLMNLKWDDPETNAKCLKYYGERLGDWTNSDYRFSIAKPVITDWSKVATRAGYPVEQVIGATDRASAIVTIGSRKLSLSYNVDGQFYPGFETPVDLVQT